MNLFCSKYKMHGMHIKTWAKLMKIYRVTDKGFLPYGNVLDFDTKEILEQAEKIEMPTDGSMHVPTKVFTVQPSQFMTLKENLKKQITE